METAVTHEQSLDRFTVHLDGATALLMYNQQGDTIVFTHAEVPPAIEGEGIGGLLAKAGLEYAQLNNLKVVPRCPFVASYMKQHPEYEDLMAARS